MHLMSFDEAKWGRTVYQKEPGIWREKACVSSHFCLLQDAWPLAISITTAKPKILYLIKQNNCPSSFTVLSQGEPWSILTCFFMSYRHFSCYYCDYNKQGRKPKSRWWWNHGDLTPWLLAATWEMIGLEVRTGLYGSFPVGKCGGTDARDKR